MGLVTKCFAIRIKDGKGESSFPAIFQGILYSFSSLFSPFLLLLLDLPEGSLMNYIGACTTPEKRTQLDKQFKINGNNIIVTTKQDNEKTGCVCKLQQTWTYADMVLERTAKIDLLLVSGLNLEQIQRIAV